MHRLLIVSNDPASALPVRDELARAGFTVHCCLPHAGALGEACAARPPEAVYWDSPDGNLDLRPFRHLLGLDDGPSPLVILLLRPEALSLLPATVPIDDFLLLPLRPGEAVARLHLLLKWKRGVELDQCLKFDGLVIDLANYAVRRDGQAQDLTFKEFELLRFLASHRGKVFTRSTLLQQIWGDDYQGGIRTVDVHILRLRSKLGREHGRFIKTIRNVGYQFEI